MPRKEKAARLLLRQRKGRPAVYVILDAGSEKSTGTADRQEAEAALADYIAQKQRPTGISTASEITISRVLEIYLTDHVQSDDVVDKERQYNAAIALERFWGHHTVDYIRKATCNRYAKERGCAPATVRRELGMLQAALNFCRADGHLLDIPVVTRPPKPEVVERYLTRQQVAIMLWATRRLRVDGRQQMQRFIITSIYTGTRKASVLALGLDMARTDAGWIDTEKGIIYRKGTEERSTGKKRLPTRCPRNLLAHARRWSRMGSRFVCETHDGNRVADIKRGWDKLCEVAYEIAAKLDVDMPPRKHLTPHILKHTAVTWFVQNGGSLEKAAQFFSTTLETLERTYWHHSPDFMESALEAIDNPVKAMKRGRNVGQPVLGVV